METTKVYYYSDGMYSREIERKSVKCPFCGVINIPEYLFLKNVERSDFLNVFTQCTNPTCRNMFITQFSTVGVRKPVFTKILPTALPEKRTFSNIISELSPNFCEIYNQAYIAEQTNLMQICGTGYRKSLEFLIKDYLISTLPEDQHEAIKNKFLNNCIRDNISNINIKTVASRAVWLGNDETHYTRKWEDKDINDLKSIIELTLHWIESEIRTQKLLEDMPEFR
ncbi:MULTISPECIES: DUF4145 domain-containing protein [Bacteroidaceae]|jgi:hypothetical protein|nr:MULTISPECIES: DUF4145 domain-containing protein [Bacteroidaceae]MCA5978254.1 DUF4145 domain-containing protein [Bacteroides thetaiotaomicron]MCE8953821.1 DUF4145 domain-containing protein [Bacteroides thetaiotaomicron]MCE8971320.1 DUF4145 domain-containing protein [Bacteroides thetaiotaomicron]